MAKIKITQDHRLDLIAEAAGQPDIEKRVYRDGFLEVEGVTQEALEAAVNDPSIQVKAEKQKFEAQIRQLESLQTPRRLREAALSEGGKTWLQDLEDEIKILRGKL